MIAKVVNKLSRIVQGSPPGVEKPEEYWINRKANVIGMATIEQLRDTRQVDTYKAILQAVTSRNLTSITDLGCNISALGQLFYDWGFAGHYTGVDSNPSALEVAREALAKYGDNFKLINSNIRELPLEDKSCECVIMKDVLEHMEDFRPFLAEAARVSGRYLIVANFIPWTEGQPILHREPQGFYHNLYSRKDVYAFAGEHGFQVEEVLSAMEKDARANEAIVFVRQNG